MKIYKIAQVAQKLGISKQTLVRYEKKGILPKSPRNHINSWRQYSEEDVLRMKSILRKGFTLIETVIVLVIVGILAALAIPRFDSFYSIKFEGSLKKVISDIRYVQQLAISRHENCRIIFNPGNDTYSAQEQLTAAAPWNAINDPFTRASLLMNFRTDSQYRGIDIFSANFNSSNILQFDWQGVPLSAGNVTFSYRGNSRTVSVLPNTGKANTQ